jgi:hypothetical protein
MCALVSKNLGLNECSDEFINWDCQNNRCDTILVVINKNENFLKIRAVNLLLTQH